VKDGQFIGDCLVLSAETVHNFDSHIPLIKLVMKEGKRVQEPDILHDIATRTAASVASLPAEIRQLNNPISPPVQISTDLQSLTKKTQKTQKSQ
jgi:nicotinate phosphoribosyltransferase